MEYLDAVSDHGDRPVAWRDLNSFSFAGLRIPLASQQGIFRPQGFLFPISIRTAPPSLSGAPPYEDRITPEWFLAYRYRGTDPNHRENVWLRQAMEAGVTMAYLLGLDKGVYDVHGAGVVGDSPAELTFHMALFPIDSVAVGMTAEATGSGLAARRHYLALVRRRAGQAFFRSTVLAAYRTRCTVCRLRRGELLDAAHIIPDYAGGQLVVSNGLALCKIHHAAYDSNLVGIRPDYVAEVRADLLDERDGPMLRHGLQEVHGQAIILPRSESQYPDRQALEVRYEQFRVA